MGSIDAGYKKFVLLSLYHTENGVRVMFFFFLKDVKQVLFKYEIKLKKMIKKLFSLLTNIQTLSK